jgi:predicted DNA-binding mobile mystery protein A
MRNQRKLLIEQLDQKLLPYQDAEKINVPASGWIKSIRTTLNMTLEQFGNRMGKTRQGARRIELSEASGTISLKLLKEAGLALDMKLVYGFVPVQGSLESLLEKKARDLARRIVIRTNQTMMLEDQSTGEEHIQKAIEELTAEIKQEMNRSLWD